MAALDTNIHIQNGEKGHLEYGWSENIQEHILQLHFQMTRCDEVKMNTLSVRLRQVLKMIDSGYNTAQITFGKYQELLITAYKMIAHTRDIIDGKGEYLLSYMQILVWYDFYPELAKYALSKFIIFDEINSHPYGSWKDIKYFCNYCRSEGLPVNHTLIQFAFHLITDQLKISTNNGKQTTLLAKWIPREKSKKFGWIFEEISQIYFHNYLVTATTPEKKIRATLKAKTDFRKLISRLNIELDTVQIKQCNNTWANIDHKKTTSITINKQHRAFLNINSDGSQRSSLEDRVTCAQKFVNQLYNNDKEMKGARIGLDQFTKEALQLIRKKKYIQNSDMYQTELDILNSQWRDNASKTDILRPMIAMVDLSYSMMCADNENPYNCALALGCRIAEKSILGKRILTFSSNPTWHNLSLCNEFVDMIDSLTTECESGLTANFYSALNVILDSIVEKKMTAEDAAGLTLVVLSDMQIDVNANIQSNAYTTYNIGSIYSSIEDKYADAGIRICGTPYKPPHILFWNLRSTGGFPCLSRQHNVSMMSGYSPAILNQFCEKGATTLQKTVNPWTMLMESMNKPRYKCMEDMIKEELSFI